MILTVHLLEQEDYPHICEWWKFWRFPIVPVNQLPNNGLGGLKLIDENKRVCCVGYLYETNSNIAWLEWVVINPSLKEKADREQAKTEIIRYLTMYAEQRGYKTIFTSIREDFLLDNFKEVGFIPSENKSRELTIKLN